MQGGSTVSWHSEVAYSWRFFPFTILCKVNRGVKILYNSEQLYCDQTILQVCALSLSQFVLVLFGEILWKSWYDIRVKCKVTQINSCIPIKPLLGYRSFDSFTVAGLSFLVRFSRVWKGLCYTLWLVLPLIHRSEVFLCRGNLAALTVLLLVKLIEQCCLGKCNRLGFLQLVYFGPLPCSHLSLTHRNTLKWQPCNLF